MIRVSPLSAATVAFTAGCLAAAGLAHATSIPAKIPDTKTGAFTGCADKQSGVLRVIDAQAGDTCKKKERTVTFNQTGPAGKTGPAGPQGAQGAPGPAGPAGAGTGDAYEVLGSPVSVLPGPEGQTVASITLPAGAHAINAAGTATLDAGTGQVSCHLGVSGGSTSVVSGQATAGKTNGTIALTGTASWNSPITVPVVCHTVNVAALVAVNVTAVRVAAVHSL